MKNEKLKIINQSLEKKFESRTEELDLTVARLKEVVKQQEKSTKMLMEREAELERANQMLRELDQRKTEFLSVIAHQLRTPLSGIKWTLDMLMSDDLGPLNAEQKSFLRKSYESNQRMIALVEDMLSADRVGSGKAQFNFKAVQLIDIIDAVLYDSMSKIVEKNIEIVFNRNEKISKVYGDEEKIRAVVQNLLDNAIKYTPINGRITIALVEESEYVKTLVQDNGIGIAVSEQKNIFNRFFRAPNALKQVSDGSGLGLFIVKGIVDKHGGTVWFESSEGKGSSFYFTLKKA